MLIEANCVKQALNTAGLSLQADAGESFLVKAIYVGVVTTAGIMSPKVDNTTVGCYRVAGRRGNHLGGRTPALTGINLMAFLVAQGLPFTIPVAEGQKLTIPVLDGAGYITVIYDRYSAGDIRADMPNGTASKKYGYIQYLDASAVLAASGDMLLDTSLSPAEFPNFPAGRTVPPKMAITLLGIAGSPVADAASGSNLFYTTYLKMIRDRNVLFDEDRNGFLFKGNVAASGAGDYTLATTIIGNPAEVLYAPATNKILEPLMFSNPIRFASGEELLVYLSWLKVGTHTMPASIVDVALIMQVDRE